MEELKKRKNNMARLWSCGFELNTLTTDVEITSASGSPTITTSPVRSGTYALKISNLTSTVLQAINYTFKLDHTTGPLFYRIYLYIVTVPSATTDIIDTGPVWITLNSNGQLILNDSQGTIGSPSIALSLNKWHRIDVQKDNSLASGSRVAEGKLDGTIFATKNTGTFANVNQAFYIGGNIDNAANSVGEWYFDDLAINDNTGSNENTYASDGKIIHLRPNATGDNAQWSPTTSPNYSDVNEVTPDDATSIVSSNTSNNEDLYNCDDTKTIISPNDKINLVHVGVRIQGNSSAISGFKVEIEKSSGGTISQSAEITHSSSVWVTNTTNQPHNYPLTLYNDPDGNPWTQTTINSTQIGEKITTANTNIVKISTVWLLVEFNYLSVVKRGFIGIVKKNKMINY